MKKKQPKKETTSSITHAQFQKIIQIASQPVQEGKKKEKKNHNGGYSGKKTR